MATIRKEELFAKALGEPTQRERRGTRLTIKERALARLAGGQSRRWRDCTRKGCVALTTKE